jgi:uncharacterized membrane protein
VGPIAILFGVLLMLLGVGFYFGTDRVSATALIPAAFGLVLVVLGALARQDKLRKHVMHAAAALGLIGFILAVARLLMVFFSEAEPGKETVKENIETELALMAVLCAAFVGLCIRSFIAARRSRARSGEP